MERYLCEQCCTRYDHSGDCPNCPEEPLLDLTDEDVRMMLQEFDDARFRKKTSIFTVVFALLFFPLFYLVAAFFSNIAGFIIYGAAVSGATAFAIKKFPAVKKLPELSESELTGLAA